MFIRWLALIQILGVCWTSGIAQESSEILPNPHGFEMTLWAREPLLKNPVALAFDDQGHLFVVETSRRGTVDIDIRSHKDWAYDDLQNQSIAQLRLFFRDKMASEKSSDNASWLQDRNQDGIHDWKDLTTMKERVYRLADTDGDGVADESKVFYEGFNEEFNGVIAGVMPWKDDVWVTVYPDLWRFRDTDQDGIADSRFTRVRGFGVHAAYDGHDIHGLTLGPEGKLYFSVGDNGFSVVTLEGKRLHYPNTGGVLRMDPDGSNLEVFAYGLRNVQEIAFDKYGNLFSVDNDGDIEDERERFVYIVEGSDSGWRLNWQFRNRGWTKTMEQPFYNPWIHEQMWIPYFNGQPAHITPPLSNYSVGPGGFKYNPGTALNESYVDHFFLAQFPVQKITAFRATPKGASFEMTHEHVFHFGLMASAMNFGPDGAMYIADWDGKWQPNEKGAIHRLDDPSVSGSFQRREVQHLLHEGFKHRTSEELVQLLGHADQRIRQRAQGAIAALEDTATFLEVASQATFPELARIHALWGMVEMKAELSAEQVEQLPFSDENPEIRAQTAKISGDLRISEAIPYLSRYLRDATFPRVQFHAAIAGGKIGGPSLFPSLVTLLEQKGQEDPFLRHAAVMGLTGSASPAMLLSLKDHPSPAVKIGAVNALRRLKSVHVSAFLTAAEPEVQVEAARAIHDDFSIPDALPSLARQAQGSNRPNDEAFVRRVLNANLRLGGQLHAKRLFDYAADLTQPLNMRVEAIHCLRVWNQRPYLDRVEGRARNLGPRNPDIGNQLLRQLALDSLSSADEKVKSALTAALKKNAIDVDVDQLWSWLHDDSRGVAARINALELISPRVSDTQRAKAITVALESEKEPLRIAALNLESTHSPETAIGRHKELAKYSLAEQQTLIRSLATMSSKEAETLALDYLAKLNAGTLPEEWALDVIHVAKSSPQPKLRQAWSDYAQNLTNEPLGEYQFALSGGIAERGQTVYQTHIAAECIRCHNAGGKGQQVGPDLTGIGARVKRPYLLEALLSPSASLAPGFQTVSIETNDGESYDGVVVSEHSDKLILGLAIGGSQTIEKGNIHSRRESQVSAMPSMKDLLNPDEVRDLVAYLSTL